MKSKITSKGTGHYFNLPCHSLANMSVTISEKVTKSDTNYRKEREHYLIRIFDTFYIGLNRTP